MIELTKEQRQELNRPEPMALDPETKEEYVLVRKEVYARLRAVLEDDFNPRDFYPLVDRLMAADDANDPTLESYQR
ncbi:MAG TPA: hypothetical protein VEL76_15815 [Gemmataceae bacterium]|nr:hypothetical protein [Gemmataceae bacterium]